MGAALKLAPGWQKGQSGNPSGRPRLTEEQKEALTLARKRVPAAVIALGHMLESDDPKAVIAAAKVLLDVGLPQWAREHREGPADDLVEQVERLRQLPDAEAAAKLRAMAERLERR